MPLVFCVCQRGFGRDDLDVLQSSHVSEVVVLNATSVLNVDLSAVRYSIWCGSKDFRPDIPWPRKPERNLLISVHSEGAIKVLSIIDSSYHVMDDLKSLHVPHLKDKGRQTRKLHSFLDYKERFSVDIPFFGVSSINSRQESDQGAWATVASGLICGDSLWGIAAANGLGRGHNANVHEVFIGLCKQRG
ncbi:hypothetical protein CASFOL_007041 [Castilleja foliolosa]|uniref:Uncharacterized protein n=1 Tax=Castilleja foliolosa TaxID=1961234 RepID=A0ABD3E842_9LAMI